MNENNKPQTEDRIETVLTALRQAEPTPGMEQRITAALLRASDGASARPSRWQWLNAPQLAGVAAVLVAGMLLSLHTLPRHNAVRVGGLLDIPSSHAVPKTQDGAALGHSNAPSATISPHARAIDISRLAAPNRTHKGGPAAGQASLPAGQAQSEQGFPAPPLPLTDQERLLLRLVHRDDPVQLSQLTPAAREAGLQRDSEQMHEFFMPPPMLAANFTLEPYPSTGGTQ